MEKSKGKVVPENMKDEKLDTKGPSQSQGQDCCSPKDFSDMQKAGSPKDYAWKKGMPSDGPFDAGTGGKSHPQSPLDKKELAPMKKKKV